MFSRSKCFSKSLKSIPEVCDLISALKFLCDFGQLFVGKTINIKYYLLTVP